MQDTQIVSGPRARIRRSRAEVEGLLGEYRSSGLTQRAFAASKGISLSTLSSWLHLRRSESSGSIVENPRLVPVELTDTPPGLSGIAGGCYILNLAGGRSLAIPPQFDEASLRRLLELFSERC